MLSEIPFPAGIAFLGREGISTFSILLITALLVANYFCPRELRRRGLNPQHADWLILCSLLGAIIGSKVFFIFEVWTSIWVFEISFWNTFYHVFFTWDGMSHLGAKSLWEQLFSGGGLVFYGGFTFAVAFSVGYLYFKKLSIWRYVDVFAIALALAYGIGRLGCFVSGDGCFGHGASVNIPLFTWVYGPVDALCPTDPALKWKFPYVCTAGVRVWNTPVIEAFFSFVLFAIFVLKLRYTNFRPGMLFAIFIVWNAIIRFLVEFIRLNDAVVPIISPPVQKIDGITVPLLHQNAVGNNIYFQDAYFTNWHWYGLTQSQLVAVVLLVVGISWIVLGKLYERKS